MVDDDGDGDCGGSDGDYDTVYDAGCGDMAVMTMKTIAEGSNVSARQFYVCPT